MDTESKHLVAYGRGKEGVMGKGVTGKGNRVMKLFQI
jgi:hypothetical protein